MNKHIADNLLVLHDLTFNHNLKMICIPRSKLDSGIENEGYSGIIEEDIPDSSQMSSVSRNNYRHLLEEGSLKGEAALYPTPDTSPQQPNHKCSEIKQCCHCRRSTVLLHLYIPFYCLYLMVGAVLFSLIEGPIERNYIEVLKEFRKKFLQKNTCVSDSDLEELIVEIIKANNRGVSAARNVTGEPNWSFGQSFFFSSTIVTTIGYGHVHPLSEGGKMFCIIFAVFGIPLTFILVTALVERCLVPCNWILHYMNLRLGQFYQPFNIRVFHLVFMGLLAFLFVMVLPATFFVKLEKDWNFLDSLYYCFISLTTIGLGDYIPGEDQDQKYRLLYKLCIAAFLLLGLTAVMLLLHLYHDIPQLNLGIFLLRATDEIQPLPERMSLQGQGSVPRPMYAENNLGHPDKHSQQVKAVSQLMESTTPDLDTTPFHIQLPHIILHNH